MDTSHHPRYSSRVNPILKRPEKRHVDEKIVLSPIHSCWKSNLLYRHLVHIDSMINGFKSLLNVLYFIVLKQGSSEKLLTRFYLIVIVYNEIFIKRIKGMDTCSIGRILDILWLLYSSNNFLIIFFLKKTIIKHFIPYYI